jgi:hypothetical protein
MKISENHIRDFKAYLRWGRYSQMEVKTVALLPKGKDDTIQCFVEIDTHGKTSKMPVHPKVLQKALLGKANLNTQIAIWASMVADAAELAWPVGLASIQEMESVSPWLPQWVWTAVENQARLKASGNGTHLGTITYQEWKLEREQWKQEKAAMGW